MVLRQSLRSRAATEAFTRSQLRGHNGPDIPLPKSLQKYDIPAPAKNVKNAFLRAAAFDKSRQTQTGHTLSGNVFESRQKEYLSSDRRTVVRPEPAVEEYLDEMVPQRYSMIIKPQPGVPAENLFRAIPAYISRAQMDAMAIYRLWPLLNQLLPPDPMNSNVTGMTGFQRLFSWSPLQLEKKLPINHLLLGWTLPMYATAIDPSSLLFDGTDARFLPGPPEVWPYRLWSSGSIKHYALHPPRLGENVYVHHVFEKPIRIVASDKTVAITIRKSIHQAIGKKLGGLYTGPNMLELIDDEPSKDPSVPVGPFTVEEYTLIFFREKPRTLSEYRKFALPRKITEFSHTLRLDRHHLFTWSGITQNAHLIHLDSGFAKAEYGAKDMVVQGSLLVFLITEWLRRVLTQKALNRLNKFQLVQIDYKFLLPTFIGDDIKFCANPVERGTPGSLPLQYKIWIDKLDPTTNEPHRVFTGTVKVRSQPWDGHKSYLHNQDELSAPDENKILDQEQTLFSEESVSNHDGERDRDDFESDGFSSPFFKQ